MASRCRRIWSSSRGKAHAAARLARPRLVFIHIPKCGGTAAARAIRRAYYPMHNELLSRLQGRPGYAYEAIRVEASHEAATSLSLNLPDFHAALLFYAMGLPKNGFISGHVPFSRAAADFFRDQWQFITILREPVSRFMSEYFYNRFKASQHFRIEQELDAYLNTADAWRTSTQLTNFLTGRRDDYAEPTAGEVESAIDNLRRFAVVGFLEDMNRFADDMAARFGRRPAIPHTNRNPAPDRSRNRELHPALREQIANLCAADVEIYRGAQQMCGVEPRQPT